MRCLHCGSTLSAFKKLTDSDFCSMEHRDQFYTEQQRLIVERLKHSGARIHRLQRGGVGESARPAAPAVPLVVEAQAPAKIAAYLSAVLDPLGRSLSLQFLPQIDPELVATNPPARQIRSGARQLLSGLIPDLLWPRYNPGLLSCVSFELADESSDIAYGSIFKLTASFAFGFTPASLIVLRRPDSLNLPARAAMTLRMAKPKPIISLGPVCLRVEARKPALPGFGYRDFIELAPIDRPRPEAYLDASPVEIAIGVGIPATLRVRCEQQARGLAFLDRVFRMRPRSGVLPSGLPATRQMLLEPLPACVSPFRPRNLSAATHYQPARIDRFIRTRPRGPVDFATVLHDFKTTAAIALRTPRIPEIERQQSEFALVVCGRPVRISLRAAASGNTEEIAISRALDFATKPINPGLSGGVDCAPLLVDRFYRPRPRGPVFDGALPVSYESELTPNGFVSQPVIRELEKPSFAFEPGLSERIFRMRPRGGVAGESVADLIPSTTAEQLVSSPATPRLVGLTDAAPSLVTRMYRIRPSSGVGLHTAQMVESISAFPVDGALAPAVIGFVSPRAANFAPALLDRLYRGRPKLGVLSSLVAEFSPAEGRPEQFASRPAIRAIGLGDCFPNVVIRLCRFRPKSAVDARTSSTNLDAIALDFPPDRPQFAPDWWDVVNGPKPLFVNRMYRMRLKQPAEDADTLTQTIRTRHLPIPDPEPVLATMPPPAQVTASPSFLDRLYRMRPKSGKAPAPAKNSIPCNALEPRPHSGAPAAVLQSVSKHWRATPLSIKAIAATIPLLLMLAFLPLGIPSSATDGKRVRDAIVSRAAIEQSDDFGEGFTKWQGVGKWKQRPSGSVEPVGLGLFTPSLELRDYRMTFSAQIVKHALGFVVRAKDDRNYQAIKLVTLKPGPLPTVAVVRYAVVDGKETSRNQIVLPMTVAADTVYRISLDVNGQSFTLMVQGKVVDFWSEEQLKSGGAGFFSAKGEQALIQNIRISHHDDAIGRLFAALVLQNVQASDGSQPK